jgi:serine/threonine protein kinase
MEFCQGSMLDYCSKTLNDSGGLFVKATDIMWQIICAIDFLHCQKINHGDLKLENVLFWKRDPKSKRTVVKLTGYGYNCEVYLL